MEKNKIILKENLLNLSQSLAGDSTVRAKVIKVVSRGMRRYMKFYNCLDQDITLQIYSVFRSAPELKINITKRDELSVPGCGMDMVYSTLVSINRIAADIGFNEIVNTNYISV